MGKPTGFKEIARQTPQRRPVELRVLDWDEIYLDFGDRKLQDQGARCMDCGIPFCHEGCPLGNIIPEWNDLVYKNRWHEAMEMLFKTNNFPEFTGRVCPAPCEEACVLGINEKPVTIKLIEQNIVEHAYKNGWVKPRPPERRTGKNVAVVGSGPAGLACAAQLNQAGHTVTVFERADRVGGLLTYGIPNFKLEKWVVERRVKIMEAEGIQFKTNANVGFNIKVEDLRRDFDAIVLCGGSTQPRDLKAPGRDLKGIHFAMDYLPQQNRRNFGDSIPQNESITAKDKHVIILGGGDTGADCLGTAHRQGAKSVCQFELLPMPPESRAPDMPWPYWPMILRISSAHEESSTLQQGLYPDRPAKIRDYAIATQSFSGENGTVKKLRAIRLEWEMQGSRPVKMKEIPGSEFELDCDLCLLAMGFVHPEHPGPIQQLGLTLDPRGNVQVDQNYQTNVPGVFAAGDLRRGQSLVVWAISEGRQAARAVDESLMGKSDLPYLKLF
ncbi:MAG: glutamate synthase subunit beta [Phycisphaerales bacterium]|jgi:glutamate synthase (NADPH/NADH) small chain|nr:glutamate synthase subunit beta [Phycisphaerales bacterium]